VKVKVDIDLVRDLTDRIAEDFDFNSDEIESVELAICEVLDVEWSDRKPPAG
jgi:hypothetical protein